MDARVVALLVATACRSESSVPTQRDDVIANEPGNGTSLIGRPLVVTETMFPEVSFSIRVPRGLREDVLNEPTWKRWQTYVSRTSNVQDPFVILVEYRDPPPQTIDEAFSLPDQLVVVEKRTLPDGAFLVLTRRPDNLGVNAFFATRSLICQAAYASGDKTPVVEPDAMLAYLDSICRSLTIHRSSDPP